MKEVKVKFGDEEYIFKLRYITYGERKKILEKAMTDKGLNYPEAEHWTLAYSIEGVEPEGLIDMSVKKKDINKFYHELEKIPAPLLVQVVVEAIKLNPLMA